MNASPLLTATEAARFLRLAVRHPTDALRRLARKGLLRPVRLGRRVLFTESDLRELIERLQLGKDSGS